LHRAATGSVPSAEAHASVCPTTARKPSWSPCSQGGREDHLLRERARDEADRRAQLERAGGRPSIPAVGCEMSQRIGRELVVAGGFGRRERLLVPPGRIGGSPAPATGERDRCPGDLPGPDVCHRASLSGASR
jgi:hypothetical protein